jgi:hypothetical protein
VDRSGSLGSLDPFKAGYNYEIEMCFDATSPYAHGYFSGAKTACTTPATWTRTGVNYLDFYGGSAGWSLRGFSIFTDVKHRGASYDVGFPSVPSLVTNGNVITTNNREALVDGTASISTPGGLYVGRSIIGAGAMSLYGDLGVIGNINCSGSINGKTFANNNWWRIVPYFDESVGPDYIHMISTNIKTGTKTDIYFDAETYKSSQSLYVLASAARILKIRKAGTEFYIYVKPIASYTQIEIPYSTQTVTWQDEGSTSTPAGTILFDSNDQSQGCVWNDYSLIGLSKGNGANVPSFVNLHTLGAYGWQFTKNADESLSAYFQVPHNAIGKATPHIHVTCEANTTGGVGGDSTFLISCFLYGAKASGGTYANVYNDTQTFDFGTTTAKSSRTFDFTSLDLSYISAVDYRPSGVFLVVLTHWNTPVLPGHLNLIGWDIHYATDTAAGASLVSYP